MSLEYICIVGRDSQNWKECSFLCRRRNERIKKKKKKKARAGSIATLRGKWSRDERFQGGARQREKAQTMLRHGRIYPRQEAKGQMCTWLKCIFTECLHNSAASSRKIDSLSVATAVLLRQDTFICSRHGWGVCPPSASTKANKTRQAWLISRKSYF